MSRRTKLTPEVQQGIIRTLRLGNSRKDSALYAGISEQTFYSWMKRGREGESPFVEFLEEVEKAESAACIKNVAVIQKAAQVTWQAAAWWLERKRPDEWGRKQRVDIGAEKGQAMEVVVKIGGKVPGEE